MAFLIIRGKEKVEWVEKEGNKKLVICKNIFVIILLIVQKKYYMYKRITFTFISI